MSGFMFLSQPDNKITTNYVKQYTDTAYNLSCLLRTFKLFFYISEFVKIRYTGRLYPLVNTFLTDTDVLLANSFILSPVLDIVPLNFWNAFFSGPSPSSASVSLSTVSSLLPLYFWFLETSCVSVLVPSPTLFPL